jgi:hypothetical protein
MYESIVDKINILGDNGLNVGFMVDIEFVCISKEKQGKLFEKID